MRPLRRRQRSHILFHECAHGDIVQPVRLAVMGDDVPECVHGRCKDFVLVIYQTEGAFQLIGAGDKDADLPAADIALQKAYGNYGQALIIQDGIAEGVRTGCGV